MHGMYRLFHCGPARNDHFSQRRFAPFDTNWIATTNAHPAHNSLIKKRAAPFPHWERTQSWTVSCSLASGALACNPPESIAFPREGEQCNPEAIHPSGELAYS
jgi:hypothetical protein